MKGDTTLLLLETVVDATNGAEVCPSVTELVDFTAPGVGTFSGMQGRAEGTFKTGVLLRRKAGGGGANSLSSSWAPLPVTLFFIFMEEGAGVEVDNGFRDAALGAGVEVMNGLEEVVKRGVGAPLEEKEGLEVSVEEGGEEEEGTPPKVGRAEEVAAVVVLEAVKAGGAADRDDAALAVGAGGSAGGGGVGTSGALLSIEAAALLLFLGALATGSGE